MAYRVYDKKRKRFIQDNIYLIPDGELVESKKSLFGNKMTFIDQNRFVYQKSIQLVDSNGTEIYIGDILEAKVAEDRTVNGIVTFAHELSSYIILCPDSEEYFLLGQSVCDRITIIGNVFDEDKKNGESN